MKRITCKVLTGAMTMAVLFGAAVIANPDAASAKVKVSKVTVKSPAGSSKKVEIAKGKSVSLSTTVSVKPNKKANKKVTYKSAKKKIATVTAKGVVKGKKAGTTKITVTSKKNKKKKATIKVVVKKAAVKKVKLNAKSVSLAVGGKKTLKATVSPTKNVSKAIQWKTSKKSVATVSTKGVVTGKKEGTATITAMAADGSKKKATCKVTVGAGISAVSVPHSHIVTVSLASAKSLKAEDFTVQNKKTPTGAYATSEDIEKVTTADNKNYNVILRSGSSISEYSYLKVTIPSLKTGNSKEIYVSDIAGYGDSGNTTTSFVAGHVGWTINKEYSISNTNAVGYVKIESVDGVPAGLTAKISKDAFSVTVSGKYSAVVDGGTMVLKGKDEAGKEFVNNIKFYVGDSNTIVGTVVPRVRVAYTPDDPTTPKYDSYGDGFELGYGDHVIYAGADTTSNDDSYSGKINGIPADIAAYDEEGDLSYVTDANGLRKAIPVGNYNLSLSIKRYNNGNQEITKELPFTMSMSEGVTVSGTVKDAAGQAAKGVYVYGATKYDEYDYRYSFSATTDKDGKYITKVVAGDYYTEADGYDLTIGNNFASGALTKDFAMPAYRVDFATDIQGAVAYKINSDLVVEDDFGRQVEVSRVYDRLDPDFGKLYAYLIPGTYRVLPLRDSYKEDDGVGHYYYHVDAYSKVGSTESTTPGGAKYTEYNLPFDSLIGSYRLSLGSTFAVTGNTAVTLNGTKEE